MIESLIGTIAIVALIIVVARQNSRLGLLEREIGALRSFVLANPPAARRGAQGSGRVRDGTVTETPTADIDAEKAAAGRRSWTEAAMAGRGLEPGGRGREGRNLISAPPAETPRAADAPLRHETPDIETALGTRWAVWVGGLALALGGLFLIRYSIEAGIFGPGVRLTMAVLLGLVARRRRRIHPPHRLQGAGRGRGRRLCAGHPDCRRRLHAVRHGLCRARHLRFHRPGARVRC